MDTFTATVDLTAIARGLRELRELPELTPDEALALAERIQAFTLEAVSETDTEIRVRAVYAE